MSTDAKTLFLTTIEYLYRNGFTYDMAKSIMVFNKAFNLDVFNMAFDVLEAKGKLV